MSQLLNRIKWDAKLLLKYGIAYVALGITTLYIVAIILLGNHQMDKVLLTVVFSDPLMYGFLFSAVMVLFEKDANIHQVISVMPSPKVYYVLSKAIVFTLLALVCALLIMLAYKPQSANWGIYILAIVLTSSLFVFIGIAGAFYVRSFNQFILTIPIILTPAVLPLLSFYDLVVSPLFFLFPTHASLILFEGVFVQQTLGKLLYAILYLILWNVIGFQIVKRIFNAKF